MKKIHTLLLLCFVLPAFFLTSCRENSEKFEAGEGEQDATIRIVAGTRSTDENWPDDLAESEKSDYSSIGSLRILGYHSTGKQLAFNVPVFNTPEEDANGREYDIKVKTGNFTIIVVANEHLMTSDMQEMISTDSRIQTLDHFRYLSFGTDAFSYENPYMPMVKVYKNTSINEDNTVFSDDTDFRLTDGKWNIALERLGIKLRILVKIPSEHLEQFKSNGKQIRMMNPSGMFLLPNTENSGNHSASDFVLEHRSGGNSLPSHEEFYYGASGVENRIILAENYFPDSENITKATTLSLTTDKLRQGVIGVDLASAVKNYTIPRNSFVDITATVAVDPEEEITFDVRVLDWTETGINDIEIF